MRWQCLAKSIKSTGIGEHGVHGIMIKVGKILDALVFPAASPRCLSVVRVVVNVM